MLPAIFVSHGSPMLAIEDVAARRFLGDLPSMLPERPKAILMVSAHWERLRPTVNAPPANETIHDFGGFPAELYEISYPAPPSADLAHRVASLLAAGGLPADIDTRRGLDHGAWVPLLVAWPEADIPVVQLSVQTRLGPEHHYRLGQLLAPLRSEGIPLSAPAALPTTSPASVHQAAVSMLPSPAGSMPLRNGCRQH